MRQQAGILSFMNSAIGMTWCILLPFQDNRHKSLPYIATVIIIGTIILILKRIRRSLIAFHVRYTFLVYELCGTIC
jgi:hypothetical protein